MKLFPLALVSALLLQSCLDYGTRQPVAGILPYSAGARTWVVLPDTQTYMKDDGRLAVLEESLQWIARERDSRRIEAVLQVGDIVDDNSPVQWDRARKAFSILDGVVPVLLAPGNHDMGPEGLGGDRDTSLFNSHFGPGKNPSTDAIARSAFEPGKIDNVAYELGIVDGSPTLVFALEFGPRD